MQFAELPSKSQQDVKNIIFENGLCLESMKRGHKRPVSTTAREKHAPIAEKSVKMISRMSISV